MNELHPIALFRYSVIGPLVARKQLLRGELKQLTQGLSGKDYDIPGTTRRRISAKTIEAWYYRWRRGDIDALAPQPRSDRGQSKLPAVIQQAIVDAKRENLRRSIDQLILLMEQRGEVVRGTLPRSSVHRLLQRHGLSRPTGGASEPEEHRSYEAEYAGDIWYGDVMHGPSVPVNGRMQKAYLVSLMDDASRLLTHSAFCTGEKALDIEGVLKQAILKRGLPIKLVVDNGAAYRAKSLKGICARLGIHLIYCRPYAPEGKGKLERWHRTLRDQFLTELDHGRLHDMGDLNARLWAWIEEIYHHRPHSGMQGQTPLQRYQQDLPRIRTLGQRAARLNEIFYHRLPRKVRKDGTVAYQGQRFEVPYELVGRQVRLVVDPHTEQAISVEDGEGKALGEATALDVIANSRRQRRKPAPPAETVPNHPKGANLVEIAYQRHHAIGDVPTTSTDTPTTPANAKQAIRTETEKDEE